MKALRMIGFEISNIMKSIFLLIVSIIVVLGSLAVPVGGWVIKMKEAAINRNPGGGPIAYAYSKAEAFYGGGSGQDPITIGGVTITVENPFYWNIQNLMQQKDQIKLNTGMYTTPEAMDLATDFIDEQLDFYAKVVPYVTKQQDYRMSLVWQSNDTLADRFIYENGTANSEALMQAVSMMKGMAPDEFKKKYIDITPQERQDAFMKADGMLNRVTDVIQKDDFNAYIALSIDQQNAQIANYEESIKIQEQLAVDNPSQEEAVNQMVQEYKRQIDLIKTNAIPILQYRLQKHIVPGDDSWQNRALSDVENNRMQIAYTTIMKEEDFMKDQGMLMQYKSYQEYKDKIQKQIDGMNNNIVIAQKSLDFDKPDMKYVKYSTRFMAVASLVYSAIVALFAVLLGGWIIASEFQQGTIRLLMIRPKKRIKILLSKFAGAFIVCLGLYAVGSVLNVAANGVLFGFQDFSFPNYSISGPMSFAAYYLPKVFACIVPVLFGFSVAFMLSTLTKNVAVSIAVPVVCYVGCVIVSFLSIGRPSLSWIAWTPAPYTWLSLLYAIFPTAQASMGMMVAPSFNIPFGVGTLVLLSAVCMFVSIVVFRKRDIAN